MFDGELGWKGRQESAGVATIHTLVWQECVGGKCFPNDDVAYELLSLAGKCGKRSQVLPPSYL